MLPPEGAIPFVIVGLVFIAWGIWPLEMARLIGRLPRPLARVGERAISTARRYFDQAAIIDLQREAKKDDEVQESANGKESPIIEIKGIHDVATIDITGIGNDRYNYRILVENLYLQSPDSTLSMQVSDDGGSSFYCGDRDYEFSTTPSPHHFGDAETGAEIGIFHTYDLDHNEPISIQAKLIAPAAKDTRKRLTYECIFRERRGGIKRISGVANILATTDPLTVFRFFSTFGNISRCDVYVYRERR